MGWPGFGASPPIFTDTTIAWFLGLSLAPWPLSFALRRCGLGRHEAALCAYNVAAIMPNIFMSVVGCSAWWLDAGVAAAGTGPSIVRLNAPFDSGAKILSVCLAYESWNTLAACFFTEYRTAAFVGHHATTFYLALLSTAPFLQYYAIFFLGPPSLSSVLLGLVDIFRHVEALQRALPTANLVLRAAFAIVFLSMRTVMWPIVSFHFWKDTAGALADGTVHSTWSCAVYLVANIFLTGLQLLWTKRIVAGLYKAVRGSDEPKAKYEAVTSERE